MLDFSNLGGVPVFNLPVTIPREYNFLDNSVDEFSPNRPPRIFFSPI